MGDGRKQVNSDVERLVVASQAGDRGAFDDLVRLYQQRAMHLAIRLLGNADDATEAVQQGFVTAYIKIDKLREPKRFESWLLRIVSNQAIDHRMAIKRRLKMNREVGHREDTGSISPFEKEIEAELQEAVRQAMLKLSAKEAKAISLFGLDDLTHREVAKIMDCSVPTARWHVFRARQKLRVLLGDYL